jgi:sugar phosphate isomerase/epimerase
MRYGGHIKSLADLDFLQDRHFDLGELVLGSREACAYCLDPNIMDRCKPDFLLIAHGPREGPPNDAHHLWNSYFPALQETVRTVAQLGIRFLTIHLWLDQRFVKPTVLPEKMRLLKDIHGYGRAHDVVISLENLSETARDLRTALAAVPELAITLDVGHGQLLTEVNTSFQIIEEFHASIRHIHLHDNNGGRGVKDDLHLPIGRGIVDFTSIVGALIRHGYDGTMTLELEREDLELSREKIRAIVGSIGRHPSRVEAPKRSTVDTSRDEG